MKIKRYKESVNEGRVGDFIKDVASELPGAVKDTYKNFKGAHTKFDDKGNPAGFTLNLGLTKDETSQRQVDAWKKRRQNWYNNLPDMLTASQVMKYLATPSTEKSSWGDTYTSYNWSQIFVGVNDKIKNALSGLSFGVEKAYLHFGSNNRQPALILEVKLANIPEKYRGTAGKKQVKFDVLSEMQSLSPKTKIEVTDDVSGFTLVKFVVSRIGKEYFKDIDEWETLFYDDDAPSDITSYLYKQKYLNK